MHVPSVTQLGRAKKESKMHQGFNLELYSRINDEFVKPSVHKIFGYIMSDEMQLKSGIVFHSRSNDVTGLTMDGDGILLDQEISDLLP